MAVFTSTAAGDHNDPARWGGAGVPGIGDRIVNNHQCNVVANWEFGDSPNPADIVATLTAPIIIGNDGSRNFEVKVRGSIQYNNARIECLGGAPGGRLCLANVPDGVVYLHLISTTHSQAGARIEIVADPSDPFILDFERENTTGAARIENGGWTGGGQIRLTGVQITLGNASNDIEAQIWNSSSWQHKLIDCRLVNCGRIRIDGSLGASSTLDWLRTKWTGTLHASQSCEIFAGTTAGAKRSIVACTFDKTFRCVSPSHFILKDNVFRGSTPFDCTNPGNQAAVSTLENCLVFKSSQPLFGVHWNIQDLYVLSSYTGSNEHGMASPSATLDISISGVILDWDSGPTNGDGFLAETTGTGTRTRTVRYCLMLPKRSSKTTACGRFFSFLGPTTGAAFHIDHNTVVANIAGMGAVGETVAGYAGEIASIRSNLVLALTDSTMIVDQEAQTPPDGMITVADFNAIWNIVSNNATTADRYVPVDSKFGSPPGQNDITTANPNVVDYTRDALKWGIAEGLISPTPADVVDYITSDPATQGAKIASLIAYVRAGFKPTNAVFRGAAHDAGDIGAVPMDPPGGGGGSIAAQYLMIARMRIGL